MESMDILYPMIGAMILLAVGFAIVMKAGNKLGWIFVAAALVWGWIIMQPVFRNSN